MNKKNKEESEQAKYSRLLSQIYKRPSSPQEDLLTKEKVEDRRQDRALRRSYANKWFLIVVVQLALVNFVFFVQVLYWGIDFWTLRLYLSATLLETFGIVYIIAKSLFPQNKAKDS